MRNFNCIRLHAVNDAAVADEEPLVDEVAHKSLCCFGKNRLPFDPAPRFGVRIIETYQARNESGARQTFQFRVRLGHLWIPTRFGKCRFHSTQDRALQAVQPVDTLPLSV